MKLYIAAVYANGYRHTNRYMKLVDLEKKIVDEFPDILESYHYVDKEQYVNAMRERGEKVFLDSGAFSAHTLGAEIKLEDYCHYIKRNEDIIRNEDGELLCSVLDGIGDAQKTLDNQKLMEKNGVRPLPCFHYGEDESYLEWYITNYDYITLGGMVRKGSPQLVIWLDRIFDRHLLDGSGKPRVKVHGFGMTSVKLMERYPWWSCDSSSWIQSAAFGSVIIPGVGTISVSDKSPDRHTWGKHVSTLSDIERERVCEYFETRGFNNERLSTVYESRAAFNIGSFRELNERLDSNRVFKYTRQELF